MYSRIGMSLILFMCMKTFMPLIIDILSAVPTYNSICYVILILTSFKMNAS